MAVYNGHVLVRHGAFIGRRALAALAARELEPLEAPAGAAARVLLARMGRGGGEALRPGAPAAVYEPLFLQHGEGRAVQPAARALSIALVLRPAGVPVQAQPAEVVRHELRAVHIAPVGVQVLEAEDELPAQMADVQPGQEARADIPQMQPPARAGREAASYSPFHSITVEPQLIILFYHTEA